MKLSFYFTFVLTISFLIFSCTKDQSSPSESLAIQKENEIIEILKEKGINKMSAEELKNISADLRNVVECNIPISPCAQVIQYNINTIYSVPGYPGCTITVPALVKVCLNSLGKPVRITFNVLGDFESWTYSGSCASLKTHWTNLYASNQIGILESELTALYNSISTYIENTYMQSLLTVYQMYCPSQSVETNVVKRSCSIFCLNDANEDGLVDIYMPACGEACCARRKNMCLNQDGTINVTSTNYYQQGSCLDTRPDCNKGDKSTGTCRAACLFL